MPTKNTRITFAVSDDMDRMIGDFQYSYRCKNKTQAILQLIQSGLDALDPNKKEAPVSRRQELSELDRKIVALLPLVPENAKQGMLMLLEATCNLQGVESLYLDRSLPDLLDQAAADTTAENKTAD